MSYYKNIFTTEQETYLHALRTIAEFIGYDPEYVEARFWEQFEDGDTMREAFDFTAVVTMERDW